MKDEGQRRRIRLAVAVLSFLLLPALAWWWLVGSRNIPRPGETAPPSFRLSDRLATLEVAEGDDGIRVVFQTRSGKTELAGEEFLRELKRQLDEKKRWGWLFQKLDITGWASLAWVGFGFLAQGVFMSRMMVQWYVSEKAKSSVVPPAFWWLSLLGASMLIVYYIWRKDPVSFLAQCFGWTVYVRNLWFIHAESVRAKK